MNSNITINIRRTVNGALLTISGVGGNQEFSLERENSETDTALAIRAKALISSIIETA